MAKGSKVTVQKMSLNKIKLSRNSRMNIDPEELDGLMQSIKEEGLLQPIGVIKNGVGYEICYGNRRFLACSKLGMATIPVIIHESKKKSDVDIKNLTENIQRRNISLAEVGRYITILNEQGLSNAEAAVRLGVNSAYVRSCLLAFQEIPKEHRDDIDIRVVTNSKSGATTPGKIAVSVARQIVNAGKSNGLDKDDMQALFKAAKHSNKFQSSRLPDYIKALATGKKDFLNAVKPLKRINLTFHMPQSQWNELSEKHVENGPFKSVNALLYAVLRGEKSVKIDVSLK